MSAAQRFRVMIVDDHPIMRDGLRDALDSEEDFEVVGQAADGGRGSDIRAKSAAPTSSFMDALMPNKNGVDACREIMDQLPDTRVLILTASTEEDAIIDAVAAGATGYLHKHSGPEELADAVRDVARGRLRIPDRSIRKAFEMIRGSRGLTASAALKALTQREREILTMFASGKHIRPDRRCPRQQDRDCPQRYLPHPGQAGSHHETGDRGLGCAKRPPRRHRPRGLTQPCRCPSAHRTS